MKKLSILALAAVGLLVGACSTKDSVEDVAGTMDGKGKGYLNVNINLPTQPEVSTRGWQEAPQLDDGIAIEYQVDNVLLAVFGGSDEASATLQQVVTKSTNWNTNGDNPNQITKTSDNIVFKLNEDVSGKLFVLAMLNYTDVVTTADVANGIMKVGDTNITTLATLQSAMSTTTNATTKFRNANNSFFMTNAVLSDLESGNEGLNTAGHAKVLAPVTKIYESETEAQAANATPSAEIFVERGLAKVTIAGTSSAITVNEDVTDADGEALATATLNGWVLDNTNKKSYIVRNTYTDSQWGMFSDYATNQANDRFRFVGVNPVKKPADTDAGTSSSLYYRSYWAYDPNYSNDAGTDDFYEPSNKTFATGNDMANPQYCFENTFSVLRQTYKNTTRVVLAVKFNGGKDFYTFNNDRKTLYTQADLNAEAAKALMLNSTFKTWYQGVVQGTSATLTGEDVTVNWRVNRAGKVNVKSFTIKISDTVSRTYGEDQGQDEVVAAVNTALGTINRYEDGIAYYAIRIKHFGDDLTPWGGNGEKESGINDIYPGSTSSNAEELSQCDKRYLGRYGVLRNNWYLLSLGSIAKLGHPIVPWLQNDPTKPDNPDTPDNPQDPTDPDPDPENPDHPDDSLDDTYLAAKIHILSWAKRPQGIILK